MSEMIGRVARAMCEASGNAMPLTEHMRDKWLVCARAAIEAMREPMEEALAAVLWEHSKSNPDWNGEELTCEELARLAINEALK